MITTLVLCGDGINCEEETAQAFSDAGSNVEIVPIGRLLAEPECLDKARILALPGGFSFADYLGSGTVLALKLGKHIKDRLVRFHRGNGLIIGICNGFQILIKLGAFTDFTRGGIGLAVNDHGTFINRWVGLTVNPNSPCVFTKGLDYLELPIRHGEGRFVFGEGHRPPDQQIVLRYKDNPNGSFESIAGICDRTGRIFGLMPHPEAFLYREAHPSATLGLAGLHPLGKEIFKKGVSYAKEVCTDQRI